MIGYNEIMDTIQKAKKILENLENVQFAYLFGSYANKKQTEKSDVDIALYLKDYNFDAKLSIHHALQRALQKEIDLVVLNRARNYDLLSDILDEGILLKDSEDDVREMFELQKEHEIKDYIVFKKMNDVA